MENEHITFTQKKEENKRLKEKAQEKAHEKFRKWEAMCKSARQLANEKDKEIAELKAELRELEEENCRVADTAYAMCNNERIALLRAAPTRRDFEVLRTH